MNIGSGGGGVGTGGGMVGMRSPSSSSSSPSSSPLFTVSQWQELEHQALILKYLMAGLPIPPNLVLPIQKSYESISHRYFHHPTMGYYSLYGKKMDPEPGRCRRTDGKKWRCSKEAYPDSKYCERHMHRGRNRSRKPVESQTMTQSSSTATSLTVSGSSGGSGNFQSLPMQTFGSPQGSISATNQSHYSPESIPYGVPSKDYRYLEGLKLEVGEHSFFSGPSGSHKGILMDPQLDNPWPLMQSSVSTFPSKSGDDSMLQNDYPQISFFDSDYAGRGFVKHEGQPLHPFFDEWPKTREAWSALEDDRSNQTSFSTTQLSISIPMASSDVSTTSSRSPHDN